MIYLFDMKWLTILYWRLTGSNKYTHYRDKCISEKSKTKAFKLAKNLYR